MNIGNSQAEYNIQNVNPTSVENDENSLVLNFTFDVPLDEAPSLTNTTSIFNTQPLTALNFDNMNALNTNLNSENNNVNTGSVNTGSVDSNNEYGDFANQLMNYINNSFNNMDLGSGALNTAINESFIEKAKYKQVISEAGKQQLKTLTFPDDSIQQESCPITQEEFLKDQEVTQLPCGHCFNSDAIMNWLEEEKSECPVCRLKLDSREVKIETSSQPEGEDEGEQESEHDNEGESIDSDDIIEDDMSVDENQDNESPEESVTTPLLTPETTNILINRVVRRAYENRIKEMREQEEDELQRALMASFTETQREENKVEHGEKKSDPDPDADPDSDNDTQ